MTKRQEFTFDNITLIQGERGRGHHWANTLFVRDRQNAVVDPGAGYELLRAIADNERVDFLINTHCHGDHLRFNSLFDKAAFLVNQIEAPAYESLDALCRTVGFFDKDEEMEFRRTVGPTYGYVERKVDRGFTDQDKLSLGDTTIRFIHAPGHSLGHTCLLFEEARILFTGDYDFSLLGPWYGNANSDIEAVISSVERIRDMDVDTILTSHRPAVIRDDLPEKCDRYLSKIQQREQRLLDALKVPRTLEELFSRSIIYKRFSLSGASHWGEKNMVKMHLQRLIRLEKVTCDGERYAAV